jgi:type I restriction enzyme S subunit
MSFNSPNSIRSLYHIPENWGIKKFRDFIFFQEGPGLRTFQFTVDGMKVLNVTNILGDGFVDMTITDRFISLDEFNSKYKHFALELNDVVIASSGNTTGKIGIIKEKDLPAILNTSTIRFNNKINSDLIDQDYLYYFLKSSYFQEQLLSYSSGSAQPNVGPTHIALMDIFYPNIDSQKKISRILKHLDSKIENNLSTNQTLEEIARTLFKEWFVNFNYPNADGNLKHSEFGEIPESWSIGTLGDIYKTTSGGTPSRSKAEYYENGTIGWIKSKELNNSFIIDTEEKITEDALKNSSAKLLPKHSVLIAMYGTTVGEIGVTTKEFTCNQAICSFLPNENFPFSFIYNFLLHSKQDIIGRAVGSAQQNISQQVLLQLKLVIPPTELVQEYHRIVFPLFQKIHDNIEENESLRDLRDSLLPRLMSGAIDVSVSNT